MDSTPPTRLSLIQKIRDPQDAEAWNEFTEIYYPLVFGICCRKGLQHADATDVAQEVLGRVASAVQDYRHDVPGATFRGWLYRITRNLTVDFFRRQKRDPLAMAGVPDDLQHVAEPTGDESREFYQAYRRQLFAVVAKVVQRQVKPLTWSAFWKTEIERRDVTEVAHELSMTRGAIYVSRSRVIAKLRKEIQKRMDETGEFQIDRQPDMPESQS